MTLIRWLNFLLGSLTWLSRPSFLDLFFPSDASICSTMAFPPLRNAHCCCLRFHWLSFKLKRGCLVSSHSLWLCPEVLSSTSDKVNLFAENLFWNLNLDVLGISLPVLLSRTNLKLHNISVTAKFVKKVITNLYLSKELWWLVLKNYKPKLSYYQLNSSICAWRNLVFQIVGKFHRWYLY